MNESKKIIIEKHIEKTIKALEKNNMNGYYAKSLDELYAIIDELVANSKSITQGGTTTLYETGVISHLEENYASVYVNRDKLPPEEMDSYGRNVFFSDVFFASSNAVTEKGELFNVDATGNRVSAMIYGPKKVILVAGANKIVSDIAAAEERLKKVTAPTNVTRLGFDTPCAKCGECVNCNSDSRICCAYVTLRKQQIKGRINVIFLADDYGF